MFTGVIKATAKVHKSEYKDGSLLLTIQKPQDWSCSVGDVIAVDGMSVPVKIVLGTEYVVEFLPEILKKTYLYERIPERVNLEHVLKFSDLVNGHIVQGHIDAIGKIREVLPREKSSLYVIHFPVEWATLLARNGMIVVDGLSLFIVEVRDDWFMISVVEHTLQNTTLGQKKKDDLVNLEFDLFAKYLHTSSSQQGIQNRRGKSFLQ